MVVADTTTTMMESLFDTLSAICSSQRDACEGQKPSPSLRTYAPKAAHMVRPQLLDQAQLEEYTNSRSPPHSWC